MTPLPRRPRLAARARLRQDRHSGGHLLLYPERGLVLNATAAAIVALCDGSHTVTAIAESLAAERAVTVEVAGNAVRDFLAVLAERGLLVEG
jgi:coenzyme PQQ biosynthesis protein PqqD